MTNQLNLNYRNANANLNRLWFYSILFLAFLVAITFVASFAEIPSTIYAFNMALCLLFIMAILIVNFKKKHAPFVKIENNQLQYLCPVKRELVVIPIDEITKVSTQFCELQVHTSNRTHCINLNKIKQEKQRWEIKEMIRKLAVQNDNRACNF